MLGPNATDDEIVALKKMRAANQAERLPGLRGSEGSGISIMTRILILTLASICCRLYPPVACKARKMVEGNRTIRRSRPGIHGLPYSDLFEELAWQVEEEEHQQRIQVN